ncbi:hypothetical protein BC629DRAFT_546431 [Irpex lacteus]|nr:hypothetical protein BC629DRAFT_546431 [Irpex lacteus]
MSPTTIVQDDHERVELATSEGVCQSAPSDRNEASDRPTSLRPVPTSEEGVRRSGETNSYESRTQYSHSDTTHVDCEPEKPPPVYEPACDVGSTRRSTDTHVSSVQSAQPRPTPSMTVLPLPGQDSEFYTSEDGIYTEQWGELRQESPDQQTKSVPKKGALKFNFNIGRMKCNGHVKGPCAPCVAIFCCPCLSVCFCATGVARAREKIKSHF